MRLFVCGSCLLAIILAEGSVRGESLVIKSSHERLSLTLGGSAQKLLWLKTEEMLVVRLTGPINLGLRIRNLVKGPLAVPPVDLTVVRDDQEQGTVRFHLPDPDGSLIAERSDIIPSGTVLVKIEIPPGQHTYRILASGPSLGILLETVMGLRSEEQAIVATPGKVAQAEVTVFAVANPNKSAGRKPIGKKTAVPNQPPPEPEILASVIPATQNPTGQEFQSFIISQPEQSRLGPGCRVTASATSMFLVGMGALLLSAAALENRAGDDRALRSNADATYQASFVMGGLALASAAATLAFYLIEGTIEAPSPRWGRPGITGSATWLSIRF